MLRSCWNAPLAGSFFQRLLKGVGFPLNPERSWSCVVKTTVADRHLDAVLMKVGSEEIWGVIQEEAHRENKC
jgi:hypothetical protein